MIVEVTLRLDLAGDTLDDAEALDTWTWALERQVEELALVGRAQAVDLNVIREAAP